MNRTLPISALMITVVLPGVVQAAPTLLFQTVTNTNDSGTGSLRAAITNANAAQPNITEIDFDLPGFGLVNIQPLTELPDITATVLILGDTQPGTTTTPLVGLEGSLVSGSADGLTILSDNSVVRSLTIGGWGGAGIRIQDAFRVLVEGCRIGTELDGVDPNPNFTGVLLTDARECRIGGPGDGEGNVISGNRGDGVAIFGTASQDNVIQGNLIGTDFSGLLPVKNESWGIRTQGDGTLIGGPEPGAGNVIAANGTPDTDKDPVPVGGVRLAGADNVVQGNLIGLGSDGTTPLGNSENGIRLEFTTNCVIGGSTSAERNVIAETQFGSGLSIIGEFTEGTLVGGNFIGTDATGTEERSNNSGIRISRAPGTVIQGNLLSGNRRAGVNLSGDVPGTVIQGNLVGTDATGLLALGNNWGVLASIGGDLIIGGSTGAGNVIAGNRDDGLDITRSRAGTTQILGNLIGAGVDGATPLGNGAHGIDVFDSGGLTVIGSLSAGNVIAHSGEAGIRAMRRDGDVTIRGNRIFANADLGIDRGEEGVTPNDDESDDVPNFPLISGAAFTDIGLLISGSIDTFAFTDITVDFYLSPICDASGHGEGWEPIATLSLLTSLGGAASFNEVFPIDPLVEGRHITATSTVLSGDTSEFSPCFRAAGRGPSLDEILAVILGQIPDPGDLDLNGDSATDAADVVTRVNASQEEIP